MSEPSPTPALQAVLKEHTAIVASIVSIILGILGIIGYFASGGDGGSAAQPAVNFGEARFGTQQSPDSLLPAGQTAGPGSQVRVCPPDNLYVWVSHDLPDGTAIAGEWLRDGLIIANERVVASREQPNFWVRLPRPAPGQYAFRASAVGKTEAWDITVTC